MFLGKTDTKSDEYDVNIFARRDVKNVEIPSFINDISILFPTIIIEYQSNGTLSDYITRNSLSETQELIILYGIL